MASKIFGIMVILLMLSFILFSAFKSATLGSSSSDYKAVCIDGHQYWRASYIGKGFLAIRLTESGTPVICE